MLENQNTKNIKSHHLKLVNIVSLLIVVLLIVYLYNNRDVFVSLKSINWKHITWIVILDTVSFIVGSVQYQSLVNRFNLKIGFLDCFLLQYGNNFLNKILPTVGGGAALRAVYLKKKYQFPYSQFVSTVAGLYVISFFSVALIGLVCLWIIYIEYGQFNFVILTAFVGILLPCLLIIIFSPQIPQANNRFLKLLKNIVDGWIIIKQEPRNVLIYIIFSIVILFLSALQTMVSYQALEIETSIVSMVFLSTLSIIFVVLNFTPDGIGVKEGVYIFSASLVGIPGNILVLGSLVLRGVLFCSTLIVGGISYWVLMQRIKKMEQDSN